MAGLTAGGGFQLVLLKPDGFVHAEAVREIMESFRAGFAELGMDVPIQMNRFDADARPILFCPQHLPPEREHLLPRGTILYNAEQLLPGYHWATPAYLDLLARHPVWDFSARNVGIVRQRSPAADIRHVPIGYADSLARIVPATEDIDVLFFGVLNERRMTVLRRLADAGLTVHALTNAYGAERDGFIARAKVVISIHFAEGAAFESARILYLLANRKAVVCEAATPEDIPEGLADAVLATPYDGLADAVLSLLADILLRERLADAGALAVRAPGLRAATILRRTLGLPPETVPEMPPFPAEPGSPFVGDEAAEAELSRLVVSGEHERALQFAMAEVGRIRQNGRYTGRALFLSEFDRLVGAVGDALGAGIDGLASAGGGPSLIVATEIYATGGHGRVLADIADRAGGPVMLVLTDALGNYGQGRPHVSLMPGGELACPVVLMPAGGLADKVRNLKRMMASLSPRTVYLLAHHEDVVAYAACSPAAGVPAVLVHHCDHHPALGSTCAHYVHADVTRTAQRLCADHLGRPTEYLPLYVQDRGCKLFDYPLPELATVTSGSPVKYATAGPLAYHNAVAALLEAIDGRHFHIGELPNDYPERLRASLARRGIDPGRFVHIRSVASVWQTLREIDACIYVGSFPVGGNRALVEALGCGYPSAAFLCPADQPFLRFVDDFGSGIATWEDLPGLVAAVRQLAQDHAKASAAARRQYDERYSAERYDEALATLATRAAGD